MHGPPEDDSEGGSGTGFAQPISSWDAKPLPNSWHGEPHQADSLCFSLSLKHRQGCSGERGRGVCAKPAEQAQLCGKPAGRTAVIVLHPHWLLPMGQGV